MTRFRRSDLLFLGAGAIALGLGVVLNPWLATLEDQHWAAFGVVAVIALAATALEVVRSLRRAVQAPILAEASAEPPFRGGFIIGGVAIFAAWAFLYRAWWKRPQLFADDHLYIIQSHDWHSACQHLFVPFNEHFVVPTRIVTWLLLQIGGDDPAAVFAVFSTILYFLATVLVFRLARRIGGDLAGLVGAAWFAVSTVHSEILAWYSASQWMISGCLLLGAMLLVEQPSNSRLMFATLFSAAAPWSYSIGALVGPFTTFWLWTWHGRRDWRSLLPAGAGIASTGVVLTIIRRKMADPVYWTGGGRGMTEAFDPIYGPLYAGRMLVEYLLPTRLFLPLDSDPSGFAIAMTALLGVTFIAALRRWPALARLWPAAALIAVSYAITVPFRAYEPYTRLLYWNRYQFLPHVGMSLIVAGIVGSAASARGPLTARRLGWFLAGLAAWVALQFLDLEIRRT